MLYPDEERNKFRYYNGAENVYGDPLALQGKILIATGGRPNELHGKVFTDLSKANAEQIMQAAEARESLERIVRDIFQMKNFDPQTGTGAQRAHCFAAWRELVAYLCDLKKKDGSLPNASTFSAGPPDLPTATKSTSP